MSALKLKVQYLLISKVSLSPAQNCIHIFFIQNKKSNYVSLNVKVFYDIQISNVIIYTKCVYQISYIFTSKKSHSYIIPY